MAQLSYHRGKFLRVHFDMKKKGFGSTETKHFRCADHFVVPSHHSHHLSSTVPDGKATSAYDQATSNDFINGPPTFTEVTGDPPTFAGFTGSRRTSAGFAGGKHTSGEFTGGQRTATGFTAGQ